MRDPLRNPILVLLLAMVVGCGAEGSFAVSGDASGSGGQADVDDSDASDDAALDVPEGSGEDTGGEDVFTPGELLDPCTTDSDCASGYCITDSGENVCTDFCSDDTSCPEDWGCRTLVNSGSDAVRLCVPVRDSLCGSCEQNTDCGLFGDFCMNIAGRAVCSRDCSATLECPAGYSCSPAVDLAGNDGMQCLPDSGVCSCPEEGEDRNCVRTSEFGVCQGVEVCQGEGGWSQCTAPNPNEEICDGIDNDCDNLIDEGMEPRSCASLPNELGSCMGTEICTGMGGWVCDARTAEPEICDDLDNDCNGMIDDGLCFDGNACTRDLCDQTTGGCNFVPFSGPCDDGSVCTENDICVDGQCIGGAISCDDGNPCTNDTCNPSVGCQWNNLEGAPCETGNLCTNDTCRMGVCSTGGARNCSTGNPCTTGDCDPATRLLRDPAERQSVRRRRRLHQPGYLLQRCLHRRRQLLRGPHVLQLQRDVEPVPRWLVRGDLRQPRLLLRLFLGVARRRRSTPAPAPSTRSLRRSSSR